MPMSCSVQCSQYNALLFVFEGTTAKSEVGSLASFLSRGSDAPGRGHGTLTRPLLHTGTKVTVSNILYYPFTSDIKLSDSSANSISIVNFEVGSVEYDPPSSGRQSQLVGKLSGAKQLRSWPPRRDGFKRRITRSYWDRRILRSLGPPPEHSRAKKQSLIPFPRTGKRSLGAGDKSGLTPSKEENQIYVYENDDEEDPEFYETEADVMDGEDDDVLTMDEDYEDSLGRAL